MGRKKDEIITFKADRSLKEALASIPNRSAFIRSAIQAALEATCPLCGGTGILSPNQQDHWHRFARHHQLRQCRSCEEFYLVCDHDAPRRIAREDSGTEADEPSGSSEGASAVETTK